jgi:hypothetical protein
MEPKLITDPKHREVLEALMQREPIFHRPEFGTTRRDFENMTESTFWEVGASGRRYSREYVLEVLEERTQPDRRGLGDKGLLLSRNSSRQLPPHVYASSRSAYDPPRYHMAANR